MAPIYEDPTVTAKKIRQALKEAFPGVKFSVRTDKYAGGSSIDVYYPPEVEREEVEKIVRRFESSTFDGMTDMKITHGYRWIDGKIYNGADYIFVYPKRSR